MVFGFGFCLDFVLTIHSDRQYYKCSISGLGYCLLFRKPLIWDRQQWRESWFGGTVKGSGRWESSGSCWPFSFTLSHKFLPGSRGKSPPCKLPGLPGSPSCWKEKLVCALWLRIHKWTRQTCPVPALLQFAAQRLQTSANNDRDKGAFSHLGRPCEGWGSWESREQGSRLPLGLTGKASLWTWSEAQN